MLQGRVLGKSVARDMALRDGVPGAMLDADASLIADGLETYFHFGELLRSEACLAPAEHEPLAWLPVTDLPDFELHAAGERRPQPSARTGLEGEDAIAFGGHREQAVRAPPGTDLTREHIEGAVRINRYPQRHQHAGSHLRVFCRWVLKARSWFAHRSSVCASQAVRPSKGSRLSRYIRTRESNSSRSSSTSPFSRMVRRWRLMAGKDSCAACASSPARRGRSRSSSTTRRRCGSASANSVRSRLVPFT